MKLNKIYCPTAIVALLLIFSIPLRAQKLENLIPEPVKIQAGKGVFKVNAATRIVVGDKQLRENGLLLAEQLSVPTGYKFKVVPIAATGQKAIQLKLNKTRNLEIGEEGYQLSVTAARVTIRANTPVGVFYGIQSLFQLMPADIEHRKKVSNETWNIPAVAITDYPRFGWRGLMLDVSRHFFPKEFVKKYIDQMVKYKMNVFHWHLTDDPGWRIEIKKYPKLTAVGGFRVSRTGRWASYEPAEAGETPSDGGFYTQEDIKEIVQYAKDRFVTIVPEVDVPGHSMAMIVAYPQVSCLGVQNVMYPGSNGGMGQNVLCAGNEESFEMLEGIFAEIAALFPGQYIHAGGDEVDKSFWNKCDKCKKRMKDHNLKDDHELQSYFMKRVEKILSANGKKMIGWDEILEGGLAPGAAVMSWRGPEGGIAAAKLGHHVVMSPLQYAYLDYQQSDMAIEQVGGGYVKLSDMYQFEPVPKGADAKYILGGQGNLWTEYVSSPGRAEYMTWPRAFGLSEILWSPKKDRNFSSFVKRVEHQLPRLEAAGVNYSSSIYDPHLAPSKTADGALQIDFHTEAPDLQVYYTFDSTLPDKYSLQYTGKPVSIPKGASELKAITYRNNKPAGRLLAIAVSTLKTRI